MSTYTKVPIEELEARFANCRAEPSMRSVTAILRITREQVAARGFLSHYPKAAIACAMVSGILVVVILCLHEPSLRRKILPVTSGAFAVSVILAYGAISGTSDRRRAIEQERVLRRMAVESLEAILASPFPRKPLDWEQVDTLRDLVKAFPDRNSLRELLDVH